MFNTATLNSIKYNTINSYLQALLTVFAPSISIALMIDSLATSPKPSNLASSPSQTESKVDMNESDNSSTLSGINESTILR